MGLRLLEGDLANWGITVGSNAQRRRIKPIVEGIGGKIFGMVSIDDRLQLLANRWVLGSGEGDLIVGTGNQSAAVTLVGCHCRFVAILALPEGEKAEGVADVLIECVRTEPVN